MVKIVGNDASVAKRITCNSCGSINEYLPNEVRVLWSGRDITGCMEVTKGFGCGNCGKEIITESY